MWGFSVFPAQADRALAKRIQGRRGCCIYTFDAVDWSSIDLIGYAWEIIGDEVAYVASKRALGLRKYWDFVELN